MKLTITAAIQARWGHRVDDLIHTHAWTVEATVEGPADACKVMPADDLEELLHQVVAPWAGHYLTDADLGPWKGSRRWCGTRNRPSRRSCAGSGPRSTPIVPGLVEVALIESVEFDRSRKVRLIRDRVAVHAN